MKTFTITLSNIAACKRHSLSPEHYNQDGSCKCPKRDDRIIVHYEKWADGTLKTGAQVFRSIEEMTRKFPEAKYKLVERPIATRRGSAMMGGGK